MSAVLEEKLQELEQSGVSPEIAAKIKGHIQSAVKPRQFKISPFRMAQEWQQDRWQVLDAFLYGTRLGLFDLEWDVKCPSCTGSAANHNSLQELTSANSCKYCKIDIATELDQAVEVSFSVNTNINKLERVSSREIIFNWTEFDESINLEADPGAEQDIRVDLVEGNYYLTSTQLKKGIPIPVALPPNENKDDICIIYENGELSKNATWFHEGTNTVRFINKSEFPVSFSFVKRKKFPWVSGTDIASNQMFRDYFSTELISADESFGVKNINFVFTDLKGSTDLYERKGDSEAYYLVKEHFKILVRIIKEHGGAIVKTIGDAVMATFPISENAIKAVFAIHNAFDHFNEKEIERDDIIVKVGVHGGPCIAVNSNDKIDYFGRTVNIAARVQGLSGGNDIMISKKLYDETGIKDLVDSQNWKVSHMQATLKGIEGFYDVVHIVK